MRTVSIIGVGRIGGALTLALRENYKIENLIVREPSNVSAILEELNDKPNVFTITEAEKITSEIILICTRDAQILSVAEKLAETINHKPFVFHTSGSLSSESLSELKNVGCSTGSIHPLISISDAFLGFRKFENAYFCVEGDDSAVNLAEEVVKNLKGKSFSIETKKKILYHAAAVTACGHIVALIDASLEMLSKCGLENENARRILTPLIKSTIENLQTQTPEQALTGTFARADFSTFEKHLDQLEKNVSASALEIYLLLGERSLQLAEKQGADRGNLDKIRKKISLAKTNLK
ncbi:MAG TPA: DUF2520 domain-containing protein [Pyrinomonadaceae bacterium]|jgi:predicted short-subunit dehydrogenase-like oxidoreductase (DUF2520 family)